MLVENRIKQELINKIRNTENQELLTQISRLVNLEAQIEDVYHFNAAQLKAVNEGLAQLDRGEFLTNEEANLQADRWLKK